MVREGSENTMENIQQIRTLCRGGIDGVRLFGRNESSEK